MTDRSSSADKLTRDEFARLLADVIQMRENQFHPLVWITGDPKFGDGVFIGAFSEVSAVGANVTIGDNCDIGAYVSINCADSHKKCIGLSDKIDRRDIVIEHNVFIGAHSMIKGGAHVGHHAVIAAGTIVDGIVIPPYSLISGNPMIARSGYYAKRANDHSA